MKLSWATALAFVIAAGLITVAAVLTEPIDWKVRGVLALVLVAYAVVWIPESMRRLGFESRIAIRRPPQAVFDLVSSPRNWPRYFPEIEVVDAGPLPLKVGDVIHDRVTAGGSVVEAHEVVTDYEPGRRFGTGIPEPHQTHGVYELTPTAEGTDVTYTMRATLTIYEAWLGSGFRRGSMARRLLAVREPGMRRIKQLLEGADPAPV